MSKIISERELEDFICVHPEALWDDIEIIRRQVHLRHGTLDILAWNGAALVIELKARALQEKDIGQVLRYTFDIRTGLQRIGTYENPRNDPSPLTLSRKFFLRSWDDLHDLTMIRATTCEPAVVPILVGTAISEQIMAAAEVAGIQIILWHENVDTGEPEFKHTSHLRWNNGSYPNWLVELNHRIHQACKQDTDAALDVLVSELFTMER